MTTINASTIVCGVIGNPIEHSISPAMHNAGYAKLGINFCYLAFRVDEANVGDAIRGMRALNIRGLSVTIPHKVQAMEFLDKIDPVAKQIGAINTIVNTNGTLKGYNTDWIGCMQAIEDKTSIQGKKVVLLGTGGAGRAIAFGLQQKGANVALTGRNAEKAKALASRCNATYFDVNTLQEALKDADVLIHTTPMGMPPNEGISLVEKKWLHPKLVVHDIVFNPLETQLIKDAKSAGCETVYGYKMLLYQGVEQFRLYTGVEAPIEVMEQALIDIVNNT